jgi:(2Fe-2S) ferredoxin
MINGRSRMSDRFMSASTIGTAKAHRAATVALQRLSKSWAQVTKERNLKGKIRVVRPGCVDVCAFGPNMMIWARRALYMKVTKADVPQIVEQYMKLEAADQAKEATAAK